MYTIGQMSHLEKQRTANVGQISHLEKQRTSNVGCLGESSESRLKCKENYFRSVCIYCSAMYCLWAVM